MPGAIAPFTKIWQQIRAVVIFAENLTALVEGWLPHVEFTYAVLSGCHFFRLLPSRPATTG
jgi:hypothetical protein